jgi:PAS domain S-box-containing protein
MLHLLRAAFELAPFGVAFYDTRQRFIAVNAAFARMDGQPPDAHTGREVGDILSRQADQIVPYLRAALEGQTSVDVPLSGVRDAGAGLRGHWSASYHPVARPDGSIEAVLAMVSDVSRQRRSDAILRAQHDVLERCVLGEPLESVLDRVTAAVSAHSVDGAMASILLVENGRVRHGSAGQLPPSYTAAVDGQPIGPASGSCGTAAYRRAAVFVRDIATDPLWRDYRDVALAHGLRACWSVPIVGTGEDVLGTFALYHREPRDPAPEDIALADLMSRTAAILIEWWRGESARRRLFEQEQDARRAAEDANRSKDEFVATLSHELRTPLNAIMGWTRMLRVANVDAATSQRAIAAIERNAEAQARLIEDLLDIARIARGGLQLEIAAVDLSSIAQAALDAVRPMADSKGVRVHADIASDIVLPGDATRLKQVMWNLLSNAVKFTPAGGAVRIEVMAGADAGRIVVTDTGVGIPADVLPYVFERYRQAEPSGGGLGLGLAIAASVAEAHGGSIRASSEGRGRGARFEVALPLTRGQLQDAGFGTI